MAKKDQDTNRPSGEMPFLEHLIELRDRLLRITLVVLVIVLALWPFANPLYTLLAEPLLRHLPEHGSMIATGVASPFLAPLKLVLVTSIFLAMPYVLYQAWAFVAPGLYRHERRLALPLLVSSILLFYLGMAFAYYIVFPLVFNFFTSVAPEGVTVMPDISSYLDFVLKLFFAFGITFEVPIAIIILVWTGITSPQALAAKRPYVIVAAFVIGMLLTPPDVVSQIMLAVPLWALFELGIVLSRMVLRKPLQEEDEEPDEGSPAATSTEQAPEPRQPAGAGDPAPGDAPEVDLDAEMDRAEADEATLADTGKDKPPAG